MKMKRIITLVAAVVMMAFATNSFAQMSVGAGYLHAGDQVTLKGLEAVEVGMNGAYAGVSYNLPISDLIGVTPGLYYSFLYTKDSAFEGALGAKVIEHFVNVPVYFNVGFDISDNARFFVFAGPTVQLGLSSKATATVLGQSVDVDRYEAGGYSRTNVLLGGGLGLNLGRFQITAGYDHGMFNLDTEDDGTKRIKRYAKAGIAYLF